MRAVLALLLLAGPCWAEPLVDLPVLFQLHADKVVVKDNGSTVYREISLGDGVVTRCKGEGYDNCVSIDVNGKGGTTDCALLSAARLLVVTRSCQIGGAGSRFMLETVINELGEHVARNAVPPRDWSALREVAMERIRQEPLPACDELDANIRDFLESRLRLEKLMELQAQAATPRLPVGKCLD